MPLPVPTTLQPLSDDIEDRRNESAVGKLYDEAAGKLAWFTYGAKALLPSQPIAPSAYNPANDASRQMVQAQPLSSVKDRFIQATKARQNSR